MRQVLKLSTIVILTTLLSGCSWVSSFFIMNLTNDRIIISYSLKPNKTNSNTNTTKYGNCCYALEDTILFNKLNPKEESYDDDILGDSFTQEYSKHSTDSLRKFTVVINPHSAISGGYNIPTFSFYNSEMRHHIFENLIEMKVVRVETQDTINLTPALLYNFTRRLGKFQIALVFE